VDFEQQYIAYMLVDDAEGVLQNIPLRPFPTKYEADIYILGYMDAVMNHTGSGKEWTDDEIKDLRGQFSIKDIGGNIVDNNNKEEAENG